MNQRTGRPAEDEFKLLCSQRNITCNPSLEDDHGWDFIIEIPVTPAEKLLADKIPAPRPVLVQVKSTRSESATIKIKLSNALRFAQTTPPCFVVLFQYNKKGERERIYARHFWKDLIERSLKRGRKASVEGKALHQSMVSISFTDQDDHTDDLIGWMSNTVNVFPIDYGSDKQKLVNNLGYERHNYRGELAIGPLKGIEELVDHQLGLTDELPVTRIKLIDSRFGIDDPTPVYEGTAGRLRLTPNDSREWTLILHTPDDEPILLPATIKSPAIPGLPFEKFKILIETWLFKATMSYSGSTELAFGDEDILKKKMPLAQLNELARFLSWKSDSVLMKAVENGLPLFQCPVNISSTVDKRLCIFFADITKNLLKIQSCAGTSTVRASLLDLRHSFKQSCALHGIITAKEMKLNFKPGPEWKYETSISHILGYIDVEVGGFIFVAILDAPITEQAVSDSLIIFTCGEFTLCDGFVGEEPDSVLSAGQASYEEQSRHFVHEYLCVGNFRAFLE